MEMPDVVLACRLLINTSILEEKQRLARATAGKLTYANMKKQLRTIHECGCNNSVSEDAKVKTEASYSDDKENTTEMCFIVITVRGTIVEIIEALIREVVVIIQKEKKKTEEMEDGRTLSIEMVTYQAVIFVNL